MAKKPSKSTRLTLINGEPDRISCLPGDVLDQILSHLPIREAVRTSVLSNKWRYKWSTLPNLVFDRRCVSTASQQPSVIQRKLTTIIDHMLLVHSGPINKFELCNSCLITVSALDRWIFHLSRRSVKELVLEVPKGQLYKLPWCLFDCQTLHHMTLYNCSLIPPSTIGFKNLKSLDLDHITMAQDSFENLISGCPLLEKLTVTELDGFTQINIQAPNLKVLDIKGKFKDISFKNTFQLTDVIVDLSLYLNFESNTSRLHGSSSNLLKFFAHLHHVHNLDIRSGYVLKYLAAGDVTIKLPTPCINLTRLWLNINFTDLKEISAALCVFRSSPNLKQLHIFAHHVNHTVLAPSSYGRKDILLGPDMPIGVQFIWIEGISGTKHELDFIGFLLQYSPILEQMTVKPVLNARSELILQLMRFKRASTQAEIVYDGKVSS